MVTEDGNKFKDLLQQLAVDWEINLYHRLKPIQMGSYEP